MSRQLKASELSPGKKVMGRDMHWNRVLTIKSIEPFNNTYLLSFEESDLREFLKDCMGVHVTEKMFRDAGFVELNNKQLGNYYVKEWGKIGSSFIIKRNGKWFYTTDISKEGVHFEYYHELQNIHLMNTGEVKEEI